MGIERSKSPVAAKRLAATARRLLDASALCAIATVGAGGRAHVNTAYFAWSRSFEIVWLSSPRATHSRNLRANDSASIAVYDSTQTWGEPDRGIQLFGSAREAGGTGAPAAAELYEARFADARGAVPASYRFYVFRPRRLKLFDERGFGPGTFVTARLARGALVWERTDVYRPAT